MARWSLLFGGAMTLLFTFVWLIWNREPPAAIVSLVGTFIVGPPAVYGISSSIEAGNKSGGKEDGSEDA
jgi:hypothetical protein